MTRPLGRVIFFYFKCPDFNRPHATVLMKAKLIRKIDAGTTVTEVFEYERTDRRFRST